MNKKVTVKIPKLIIFIVAFLFVTIIVRLSYISLSTKIDGINLQEFASNRNTKEEIIYAKRGNIYDKDGNTLATTVNSYKIIAYLDEKRTTDPKNPNHVVDKEATAKMLNEMLGIDYDFAMEQLNKDKYQVEFGKNGQGIKESMKNKIKDLDMPGIDFIVSQKRHYNMGQFASYIIGYAKVQENGEINGELGIEKYYNEELSGVNGKTTYQTDAYGYTLPSATVETEDAVNGQDIYLTIDQKIQLFAETLTRNLEENYSMDWMVFAVMDAKTGAIVASSTYPNFNSNDLNTLQDYKNPLVSNEYEPGSVMKIFSWATDIDLGTYDGNKTYNSGKRKIGNYTIHDHNNGVGWGNNINFDTGFAYSSNVAASYIADQVGLANLMDYYKKLGFSKKTGITLANEINGKIAFTNQLEMATAAFGQGITVTPIQMLQALTAITNDGTVLKPYIVDKIVDSDGNIVYDGKREEVAKVFSKETTDYMKKLMHTAVYDGLTSYKNFRPTKTTLLGKTGTAQIVENGKYLDGKYDYVRSFAGIFPEEDPEYIVYIAVKKLSASNAVPIANEIKKIVDDIVAYKGLENTEEKQESKIIKLDNYISADVLTTTEELKNKKLNVYSLGTGKYIINQYPLKDMEVLEGSKVFLQTNNLDYKMLDLTGWSLNEVMTYASLVGLTLDNKGYGYVKTQSIPIDTVINKDMVLTIELEDN